jgi:hypothetical protein
VDAVALVKCRAVMGAVAADATGIEHAVAVICICGAGIVVSGWEIEVVEV